MKHYIAGTILCPKQHATTADVRRCEGQRIYDVRNGRWAIPELVDAMGTKEILDQIMRDTIEGSEIGVVSKGWRP